MGKQGYFFRDWKKEIPLPKSVRYAERAKSK
jgi:hypothetical protein